MQRRSATALAVAAALASTSMAQQPVAPVAQQPATPVAQQPATPVPQQPAAPEVQQQAAPVIQAPPVQYIQPQPAPLEQGFFRPAEDPALTRVPTVAEVPANTSQVLDAQVADDRLAREAAERDVERAAREHREAQASPAPRPIVVSPLEGSAPITSPLDGTSPILSPIGR